MVDVTAANISGSWRPLSAAEERVVPGFSKRAWTRIKATVPDIEDKLAATPAVVTAETVQDVMVSMIIRVLKNPDSARQISKSADDWSKSITVDASVSTGELYLTAYELELLNPVGKLPEYGMYVVSLGG